MVLARSNIVILGIGEKNTLGPGRSNTNRQDYSLLGLGVGLTNNNGNVKLLLYSTGLFCFTLHYLLL